MAFKSGTIDTSTEGNRSSTLAITNETIITLDVKLKSGTHNNSRCELQHSPDNGATWFPSADSTNGTGTITAILATTMVRVNVLSGEDSEATASYFITAK